MATRASEIPATHRWQDGPFADRSERLADLWKNRKGAIGFSIAATLLVIGWSIRDYELINAEQGLGYFLGIVSVSCMLILLLYPLRKRFRLLKFIGPLPKWFRNHMILGVSAPIAALYHCNFNLGSLNSRIALFSALAVAGSGLVGRFIYTKIHHGLYGRKANLKELLERIKVPAPGAVRFGPLIPELSQRLTQFDHEVLQPPKNLFACFRLPLIIGIKTRIQRRRLMRFVSASLEVQSRNSEYMATHRRQFEKKFDEHITNHLRHVRRVAEYTAYDRLFALWHKVHFPFFVLLIVSVIVHVAVVHLY